MGLPNGKVLWAPKRCDGYLEGCSYVGNCYIGHLVELAEPHSCDARYKKWSSEDLPVLP